MEIKNINLTNINVVDMATLVTGNNQLLYLDAGYPTSYSGSGSVWYDISGNNNNTNGTSNAVYINGNGGYFLFTDPGWFTTASSKYNVSYTGKTIFMAAKLTGAMGNNTYRCMFGSNGSNRNFNLYFYYNGSSYQLHYSAGGVGPISVNMPYTINNWGTFAVTHTTAGAVTYYYNGVQLGSTQTGISFSQYLSTSSENVGASDNYWSGPISVVGIYGSALTAAQILSCHNSVRRRYGLT